MKLIYFVLLLIGAAAGKLYDGLRMKYGAVENSLENFFKIPRTVEDAEAEGWRKTDSPPGPMKPVSMYCWQGNYVCLLFAASEFIIGVQFAFPADDIDIPVIDPDTWFTKWQAASGDGEPAIEYLTIALYFASEEFLAAGAGPEAANGSTLQDNGVWVYNQSKQLMRIPLTETEIRDTTPFTKQNCIPKMGTHYQYNMTREMRCENQLPWFAITINGEVIGIGLQFFGQLRNPPKNRDWFETLNSGQLLRVVIPHGPDCLYENADLHSALGIHVYFIDKPASITCRDEDSIDPSTIPAALRQ